MDSSRQLLGTGMGRLRFGRLLAAKPVAAALLARELLSLCSNCRFVWPRNTCTSYWPILARSAFTAVGRRLTALPKGQSAGRRVASRSFINPAYGQPDPGRTELKNEFLGRARLVVNLPLVWGGSMQVRAHAASERSAPPGAPANSVQEWRTLRFTPAVGSTDLIQSVRKVYLPPPTAEGPRVVGRPEVLGLAYTKTFVTVVLSTLVALGAPVLPAAAGAAQEPLRVLCIGLGGGAVPCFFTGLLDHCEVDVVELEPAVLRVAEQEMGFNTGPRLRAFEEDGAAFAMRAAKDAARGGGPCYDAVLVDAYTADGDVPLQLWSAKGKLAQAFATGLLKPSGLVAVNFLPAVDLTEPISAFRSALAVRNNSGIGFSVQAHPEMRDDAVEPLPSPDIKAINAPEENDELPKQGNRIAVFAFGKAIVGASKQQLCKQLEEAAAEVSAAVRCPFDMTELAARGLRVWR